MKAGTFDADPMIDAMVGVSVPNLSGGPSSVMLNHHVTKPLLIGGIQANKQFGIVSRTPRTIVAQEWSGSVSVGIFRPILMSKHQRFGCG